MKTKITELLQIEYPIFQGGMAWVAEHKLAAAVSNAGGLGIIGAASAPPEVVREEIRKCKELTDKPFGVNIMLLNPNAEEVVEEGVQAVTTGAGNPGKFMELWKNAGVKVIPVVASVAMAKMMERAGADAVVAEGMESGGHIGSTTTMALVPQVVDAVSIPVIAAGGIADGRGMAAAFMLGAEGIQMGTRFVASKESIVHENYKNQIIKAKDIDSVVTGMFPAQSDDQRISEAGKRKCRLHGAGKADVGISQEGSAGRRYRKRNPDGRTDCRIDPQRTDLP